MKKFKHFIYINSYGIALVAVVFLIIATTTSLVVYSNASDTTVSEPMSSTETEVEWLDFTASAYCACEICCEEWAHKRPVDKNGKQIVYGASCQELHQGISIAADWDVLPVNTKVEVEGIGCYIVQDKGGSIKGNKIDIYFENHQEAQEFGVQGVKLRIVEEVK